MFLPTALPGCVFSLISWPSFYCRRMISIEMSLCLFCSIEKVCLQEKQVFLLVVVGFFPPFLSGKFEMGKRTSKYQMSWKMPCFAQRNHAVYEMSQCSAKPLLPSGTTEVEILCCLTCFYLLEDSCEDDMHCYGSPATVFLLPLKEPFGGTV